MNGNRNYPTRMEGEGNRVVPAHLKYESHFTREKLSRSSSNESARKGACFHQL